MQRNKAQPDTHLVVAHKQEKSNRRGEAETRNAQKTQAVNWNSFVLHAPTRTNTNTRSCRLAPDIKKESKTTKKSLSGTVHSRLHSHDDAGQTSRLEPRAQLWRQSEQEGRRGPLMLLGCFHLSQHLRQFDGKVWLERGCKTKQLQSAHARADADKRRAQLRLIFLARR